MRQMAAFVTIYPVNLSFHTAPHKIPVLLQKVSSKFSLHRRYYGIQYGGLLVRGVFQLLLQIIAQRHQRIDFGDDALLLGEGREGKEKRSNFFIVYLWHTRPRI